MARTSRAAADLEADPEPFQAHKVLRQINGGLTEGSLLQRFQTSPKPNLLVLGEDELEPLIPPSPDELCGSSTNMQRGHIWLIGNRVPEGWFDLSREPLLPAAGLEELTHQAQVAFVADTRFRAHRPKKEVSIEPMPS